MKAFEKYMIPIPTRYMEFYFFVAIYLPKINLKLDTIPRTSMKVFEKYMVPIPTKYMEKNMVIGIYLQKINLGLNTRPKASMKVFENYMVLVPTTCIRKQNLNTNTNHQFSKLDTNTM
jgi:hypothetical protein